MSDAVLIAPGEGTRQYWQGVWRHRELLALLARKQLLVRYKETAVGVAWLLLKPALTLLVFTLVFGRIASLPSEGAPYAAMVFAGLLPWLFFATAIADAGESLTANAGLLTKVYFPRAILPASAIAVCAVDFALTALLFVPLAAFYGVVPGWRIAALPLFFAMLVALVAGLGLLLAALSAKYRDFRHVTPFVVQLSLYGSPVGYSSAIVPEQWKPLFYLNPLAGIIDGFRWALLGSEPYAYGVMVSAVFAALALFAGAAWFRATERTLADRL